MVDFSGEKETAPSLFTDKLNSGRDASFFNHTEARVRFPLR